MDSISELRIIQAGRGWYRIWRGNGAAAELIAACPSYRTACLVRAGLAAMADLRDAQRKIALLEQTLESRLKDGFWLFSLLGGRHE